MLKTSWVSNLRQTNLAVLSWDFHAAALRCHLELKLSENLPELWLHKEIPCSILRVKIHHVCNLIQKDFTYSGRNGARGKPRGKEKDRNRERKIKVKYQHWEIQVKVIWKVLLLQLFLQLFCKSQIRSKEKKLKGENKAEKIHCSDTYTGKKKY